MVKYNIHKDEAAKLVYYDSGEYLKEFKENFKTVAER